MRLARTRKSTALIALNVAIVLLVAGGTAAYGAMSQSVTITVEGKSESIRTFGGSVSDVLEARDIELRADDRISHDPSHQLSDGDSVEIAYAKPLTLSLDGQVSKHTVYELTLDEALEDIAVDVPDDAYVSEKPTRALTRSANTVVVSTKKDLTIEADGDKQNISTTAPTVAEALEEAGITVGEDDEVEPGISDYLEADQTIQVVRIKTVTKTETLPVKFDVDVKNDADAPKGKVDVLTPGANGEKREKVELVYADGEVRERTVVSRDMVRQPITQVESHGTKVEPVSGVWAKLAACESGGNPSTNTGNGYYGLYQFSQATWNAMGGSGRPSDASASEQTRLAKKLQAQSGWGQWPGCAKKLGLL